MNRRRILVLLGLLLALGLVVLLSLATMTFDSPALGEKVLSAVSSYGGLEIEAEEFRVALLDGLRLGKVHAVATLPAGKVTLDADIIRHDQQNVRAWRCLSIPRGHAQECCQRGDTDTRLRFPA